jgi:esterase
VVNEGAMPSVEGMSVVPLFHRALGGAGKPPLIVLHGLLGSSRNWQTTGADLAVGREVWALDLRNHGKSPHDPVMSYAAMADDVLGWMDTQGLGEVELMGHSMGGKVAMLLACRHPHRVRGLVIVDIAPRTYSSQAHRAELTAMMELNLGTLQSRGEAELRFEARVAEWAMRKFLVTNLDRTEDGQGWRWQVNLSVLAAALPELEGNPLTPADRYAGPVQVIAGGKSRYVRDEDHAAIRTHFPNATIAVIAEAGHNPHMETRTEFVRAVTVE